MGIAPSGDSGGLIVDSLLGSAFDKVMEVREKLGDITTVAPYAAALALIAPYASELSGVKGDPGGNATAIGLFNQAHTLNITVGTDLVQTSGYSVVGKGFGLYAYDAAVNAAYVAANPRSSFITANGRGFKLASFYRTPFLFGAIGDQVTDDAPALQAFFNDVFDLSNARNYGYDKTGDFAIGTGLIAAYSSSPTQLRRFYGNMTLRNTAGATVTWPLTIAGYNQHWNGTIELIGGSSATDYLSRGFVNGVRLFNTNGSRYNGIYGRAIQRTVCLLDPKSTSETFQAGTPFQVTQGYSNNIGITIDFLQGYFCGSKSSVDLNSLRLAISANVQEGAVNSLTQRSLVTVPSTANVQSGDYGFTSFEKLPADYGTITADNTAGTFTRSTGDWALEGWAVNDLVHFVGGGGNSGFEFKVTAVTGTTLTVSPKPVTVAATAGTMFRTKPRLHRVYDIVNGTQMRVMPWIDSRVTPGTWRSCTGGVLATEGPNTANVRVGTVYGLGGGITLADRGLYGVNVNELLGESGDITYMTGGQHDSAGEGRKVGHVHSESSFLDYVQISTSNGQSTKIEGGSGWGTRPLPSGDNWQQGRFTRMLAFGAASNSTNGLAPTHMRSLSINTGRVKMEALGESWGTGIGTTAGIVISNRPGQNRRHQVVTGGIGVTITLDFDPFLAELAVNSHWAEVYWERATGLAPTGTMSFVLPTWMTTEGWTLPTVSSWTAPGTPMFFQIIFDPSLKKVSITPFSSGYFLIGSVVYNPPSLALGAKDTIQTITINGAALGDHVSASFSLNLAGANIRAWVSAANTVSYYFVNENGANPLDLVSGTVYFRVFK